MKTLDTYLSSAGAKTANELAAELGVTKQRISQLRYSVQMPPELALKIEAATAGFLDASKLSPIVAQARAA